jgi:hypothetical protein
MGKDERKKVFFSQLFRPKVFDIDFPQKFFYGVFELPLLRNAQKRHKKNLKALKKKKCTYLPDLLAIFQISVSSAPSHTTRAASAAGDNLGGGCQDPSAAQAYRIPFLQFLFY